MNLSPSLLPGVPTPGRGLYHFIPGASPPLPCLLFLRRLLASSKLFTSWAGKLSRRPRSSGLGIGQQTHRGPADHTSSRQISFLGGLALNEGVNWLIKHVIQEPRPCGGRARASGLGLSPVGTFLGGLHPPLVPCSLSPRSPHGSGHQVRDALQSFPVYVVFFRLLLPFSVFKVSFCPGWSGSELA